MLERTRCRVIDRGLIFALCLLFSLSAVTSSPIDAVVHNDSQRISEGQVFTIRPQRCTNNKNETGVCMFNFECYRRTGLVIGTCIDRFMFGACCQLDPSEQTVAQLISAGVESSAGLKRPPTTPGGISKPEETTSLKIDGQTANVTKKEPSKKQPDKNKKPTATTTTDKKKPSASTGEKTKNTDSDKKDNKRPTSSTVRPKKPEKTTTKAPKTTKKPAKTTSRPTKTTTTKTTTSTTTTKPPTKSTTTTKKWDYTKHCGVIPLQSRAAKRSMTTARRGRIVGGETAYFAAWPWQVLVKEATFLGLFTKNKCGGVLINSRFVLTAAHCQPGFLATLIAVFGDFDLLATYEPKSSYQRNVRRIIVHRGFNAQTFENDLALLQLDRAVVFDEHVVPICLPSKTDTFESRLATVTGWGRMSYGGEIPTKLMQVQVPVIDNKKCQRWFDNSGHNKRIVDGFQCAGYKDGVKDSCEGDSGGPLVTRKDDGRWVLVGTVSHGIKCAWPHLPGIYMRMPYYRDWLDKHMRS